VGSSKGCLLDRKKVSHFPMFPAHGKNCQNNSKKGQDFFPTCQDPANILGTTYFHSDNFADFLMCLFSRLPDFQIPRFQDFQTPPAPLDELSDPNMNPLSQRTQGSNAAQGARSPCCDCRESISHEDHALHQHPKGFKQTNWLATAKLL